MHSVVYDAVCFKWPDVPTGEIREYNILLTNVWMHEYCLWCNQITKDNRYEDYLPSKNKG